MSDDSGERGEAPASAASVAAVNGEARRLDMRSLIIEINKNPDLSPAEKQAKIQEVMLGTHAGPRRESSSAPQQEGVTDEDLVPSYRRGPDDPLGCVLGCAHYQRSCKIRCPDPSCRRFFTCRICHDEAVWGHALDRKKVTEVLCMVCGKLQPAAKSCKDPGCGTIFGNYYCDICHLWESTPGKSIFHCDGRSLIRRRKPGRPQKTADGGAGSAPGAGGGSSEGGGAGANAAEADGHMVNAAEPVGAVDATSAATSSGSGSGSGSGDGDVENGDVENGNDDVDDDDGEEWATDNSDEENSDNEDDGASASDSYEYVPDPSPPESDGCGICRVGRGLGIDFKHCPTCRHCVPIGTFDTHECKRDRLSASCPFCAENLFNSRESATFLKCGHPVHAKCLAEYASQAEGFLTCPTCRKSVYDYTSYFRALDAMLQDDVMPEEYRDKMVSVLCNDCELTSEAKFHFMYHKCGHCGSYNTLLS